MATPPRPPLPRELVYSKLLKYAIPDTRLHYNYGDFVPDFRGSSSALERLKGWEMDAVGKQKQPPELEQPHERAEILDICLQKQCQYIMFQQITCAVWE